MVVVIVQKFKNLTFV